MWEDIRFFQCSEESHYWNPPKSISYFWRVLSGPMHRLAFVKMTTHLSFPGIIWGQQMCSQCCAHTPSDLFAIFVHGSVYVALCQQLALCVSFWEGYPQTPIIPFIWVYREMELSGNFYSSKQCSTNDGWIQRFKHTSFPVSWHS